MHEIGERIVGSNNTATIWRIPAHQNVGGEEVADTWAEAAAEGRPLEYDPAYQRETSLSHMTIRVTEARSQAIGDWITEHVRRGWQYGPLGGNDIRLRLRRERKAVAFHNHQHLPGHEAIGLYLCDKIGRIAGSECWWCRSGEQQSGFQLVARCSAWAP